MNTVLVLLCAIAIIAVILIRRRRARVPNDNYLVDQLCNEARTKYPGMSLQDALGALYLDYYDRTLIARGKGEDVTELIEARKIIAQERAFLIVLTAQLETESSFSIEKSSA
jgi:hypothetical protein